MKKMILSLVLAAAAAGRLRAAVAEDSKIFTPFFDMTLSEAAYLPSVGNIFSGGNINTQVGLLAKASKNDHFFGLYGFNYGGPGFAPQDSKQFSDRSMTHSFNIEYRRQLGERFRVRPGFSLSNDYSRSGANEAWKNGLYNMSSSGLQLAVDYTFNTEKNGLVTVSYMKKGVKFPNYTDLLSEFQNAGSAGELGGGLQDQDLTQISVRSSWNKFFGGVTQTRQAYRNQAVISAAGTTGGRGSEKQADKTLLADFGFHHTLWVFEMSPMISYSIHRSNQNFLRFKSLGATSTDLASGSSDVTFVAKNYDYNEISFSVPVDLLITSKWAVGGALNVVRREYTSRPRRDAENNYILGDKQKNLMSTLTGSIRKRINDVAMVRLYYSLTVASSNNKFERYMPYNYTGNTFGLAYQLSY